MIYAYDQWAQMPVRDLYDSQMMAMAINAAKDMYDRGQQEIKDFKKEYGNFSTPFAKDMERYKQMVGGVNDIINKAYANGVDLLRSPQGRMIISQAINSINPADINEMRENAKWGTAYKQAQASLMANDKFSQDAENFYLKSKGLPSFEDFSTIGPNGEHNQWRNASPMAFKSLKEVTNDWFDKRTPYELTPAKAKQVLGKEYDARKTYTGFLDEDLMKIAGNNTTGWQGSFWSDYYRNLAKRQILASGGDPNDANAVERQLQRNIADAQQEWIVNPVGDLSNWFKQEDLRLNKMRINIARQAAAARQTGGTTKSKPASGTSSSGGQFDYQDFLIGTTAANVLGKTSVGAKIGVGGVSDYTPEKVSGFMGAAQKEIAERVYNYKISTPKKPTLDINKGRAFSMQDYLWNKGRTNILTNSGLDIGSKYGRSFNIGALDMSASELSNANNNFLVQLSVPSSPENFAKWTQRKSDNDNPDYVIMNLGADKGRIYSADEVALTSAGVNRPKDAENAKVKTKDMRKKLVSDFKDGKTMMKSEGFIVGRVGDDGAHHVFQKIRIANKKPIKVAGENGTGTLSDFEFNNIYNDGEVIYYDMGADTQGNPNYRNDYMENMNPVVTDQSLGSDRNVLKDMGLGSTNVKSDNSVPDLNYQSYDDVDLLDLLMGD